MSAAWWSVKGHECPELRRLQVTLNDWEKVNGKDSEEERKRHIGCSPTIEQDGRLRGCDAESVVAILFCPMCGEKLESQL